MPRERFRPDLRRHYSPLRVVADFLIGGTKPSSFRESVTARTQFERKDEISPNDVQGIIIVMVMMMMVVLVMMLMALIMLP